MTSAKAAIWKKTAANAANVVREAVVMVVAPEKNREVDRKMACRDKGAIVNP